MFAPLRRTASALAVLAAVPTTVALSVLPAQAVPDPGAAVADTAVAVEGCNASAAWPTYPGWRGPCLAPALRGPVLVFLDS
jgi:hypothetical protein